MRKVKITCDSTCDLDQTLYGDAHVIALGVSMGDDFRHDGVDVTADELLRFVADTGTLPKTSAISIGEYEEVFRGYVEQGFDVVHINLSSALSASYQNAVLAAQEVGHTYVVDSRNLSSGSGHLVMVANELAEQGMNAAEIAENLTQKAEKLDVSFVLQTLDFLHKGGRCSGIAAFGANLMKLRPEIQVVDGKMQVGKKYRGDMHKSIMAYVRGRLEEREDVDCSRIFITHSGVPQQILEAVKQELQQMHPFREILVTRAGCTITSHCGPGCLGVLFFKK